jgi:hypothetical protein
MKDKELKLEMCLLKLYLYVCPCYGAKDMIWSGGPDVFGPGTGILNRFVNISYSWLNRIICTYSR